MKLENRLKRSKTAVRKTREILVRAKVKVPVPDSLPINPAIPGLVTLGTLKPGQFFTLYHGKTWFGDPKAGGQVISIGQGSATVKLLKGSQAARFAERDGTMHEFLAQSYSHSQWSLGTLVVQVDREFFQPQSTQDNAVKQEDGQMENKSMTTKKVTGSKPSTKPGISTAKNNSKADQPLKIGKGVSLPTKAAPPVVKTPVVKAALAPAPKPVVTPADEVDKARPRPRPTPTPVPAVTGKVVARGKDPETKLKPCGCGCGEQVANRFRQGHDGRFYGWMKRIVTDRMAIAELNPFVRTTIRTKADAQKALDGHGKH